ncbi:MAG: MFS transporter [Christensenellales bacterium]|nr:MFS transporter [Christensenellales bacterium]
MRARIGFRHTLWACYIGYVTQAIVNNFMPLLFITFHRRFSLPLSQVALLSSINFGFQLVVDFIAAKVVDKIGYRNCIVAAHVSSAAGLAGIALFPPMFANPFAGLLLAVLLCSIGGGLCEVLVSPIAEACPTEKKDAQMSLLHSFYCIGVIVVIIVSTMYFSIFGTESYGALALFWALVPMCNIFLCAMVPINSMVDDGEGMGIRELCRTRIFWLLALLMVCSGASELAMAQWASAFTESALMVSKAVGDMMGPCVFALLMLVSRVAYARYSDRINLSKFMIFSSSMCVACYLLATLSASSVLGLLGCGLCGFSVGIMWPGTFSIATVACRKGGTVMFALLALAGDLGGSVGPALVSGVSQLAEGNLKLGLLAGIVFPVLLIGGLVMLLRSHKEVGRI